MNEDIKKTEAAEKDTVDSAKQAKSDKADTKKENAKTKKALEEACAAVEELKKEKDELNDRYLRLAAEYDNFRKRAVKEKEDAYGDAYIAAVKELLPVIDNLERAEAYSKDSADEGSMLILKQLREALTRMNVEEIPAKGLPFDPNFHNAVMLEESSGTEENTVTEVFQKGYTVRGKIIRFAMVKVAK